MLCGYGSLIFVILVFEGRFVVKIFIIDDLFIDVWVFIMLFEGVGYFVFVVSMVEEGVECVCVDLFDLVIMDVIMLGMNGF